jgi:hypothetical protein
MSLTNWVNELRNKIIEKEDEILFDEVAGCLSSNYLRASYILCWTCLIESLKRKISRFASLGDIRSNDALKRIEDAEKLKNSADKLIFEEAAKCGIIEAGEVSVVQFLWEQRCLFAHPYEKQPDVEEVKHIISQSVKISLGKELLFNKTYLEELCKNIAEKPFFLPNDIDKVRNFAQRTIGRTPEKLHPFFFKTALGAIGGIKDDDTKLYEVLKLRYHLVELFLNTTKSLEDSEWSLEHRATNYPFESFIGYVHSETWAKIPARIKEMLIAYLESCNDLVKLGIMKAIVSSMIKKTPAFEAEYKTRYYKKLKQLSFDSAITGYGNPNGAYQRIIDDLKTYRYNTQNPVIDYLKSKEAIELVKGLDFDKQRVLGQILYTASNAGHWKTRDFISSIKSGSYDYSDHVKSGIVMGYFSEAIRIPRFEEASLRRNIELVNGLEDANREELYQDMKENLKNLTPDKFDKNAFKSLAFTDLKDKLLDEIEWNGNHKAEFQQLAEAIIATFS